MKSIRKHIFAVVAVCAFAGLATAATLALYTAFSLPAPGMYKFGNGLGQVAHIRISGANPATGTVIISRVTPTFTWGSYGTNGLWTAETYTSVTNACFTNTCVGGVYEADVPAGIWFSAGDWITRDGTATNGSCLLYLNGQQ